MKNSIIFGKESKSKDYNYSNKRLNSQLIFKSGLILSALLFPFMRVLPIYFKFFIFVLIIINFFLQIFHKKKIRIDAFSLLILLFSSILILGNYSNNKMLLYFVLFFAIYNIVRERIDAVLFLKISFFSLSFLSILVILSFFKIINFFHFHHYHSGIIRLWGFTKNSNPNNFALLFTLIFPFIGYFYKDSKVKKVILLFMLLFSLLLTQSKAVILPIVLIFPIIIFDSKKLKKRIFYVYGIFFLILLISIPIVRKYDISKRIVILEKGHRDLIWKASFDLILENPLGYFQQDYKKLIYEKIIYDYDKYINKPKNTHNLMLYVFLQTGIIGFFIFVLFLSFIFYKSIVLIKYDEIFLYFALSFFIFFSFNLLHFSINWFYFWVFLGVWSSIKPETGNIKREKI
jgi:O-antigen ligase